MVRLDCKLWHFQQYLVGVRRCPAGANLCEFLRNPSESGQWCEFGPIGASAYMGRWFINLPQPITTLIFTSRSQNALQMWGPTPYSFEALLWWFSLVPRWCEFFAFFLPGILTWLVRIIGAFWCKFSTGPMRLAKTGDILYSLFGRYRDSQLKWSCKVWSIFLSVGIFQGICAMKHIADKIISSYGCT